MDAEGVACTYHSCTEGEVVVQDGASFEEGASLEAIVKEAYAILVEAFLREVASDLGILDIPLLVVLKAFLMEDPEHYLAWLLYHFSPTLCTP